MNRSVHLVIVNYNTSRYIEKLLKSISNKDVMILKSVLVIDNDSNDSKSLILNNTLYDFSISNGFSYEEANETTDMVDFDKPKVIYIKSNHNGGFAYGNNLALRWLINLSNNEYIWMLNPDVELYSENITNLVNAYRTNSIFGSILNNTNNTIQCYGGGRLNRLFGIPKKNLANENLDFISGASMFFDVNTLKKIGLMPEEYFLYWEETDWCEQAKRKGIELSVCDSSVLVHEESVSTGLRSKFQYQQDMRNTLLFFKKYYGNIYLLSICIFKPIINNLSFIKKTKKLTVRPFIWSIQTIFLVVRYGL